jgi:ferritin-like metal-binding protein YciE
MENQKHISGIKVFLTPKEALIKSLFKKELEEMYNAEIQLLQLFPEIIKATNYYALRWTFEEHNDISEVHLLRLKEIFTLLNIKKPEKLICLPIKSLTESCKKLIKCEMDEPTKDLAMVSVIHKIEHYEMAAYNCLKNYSYLLGYSDISDLLQATFEEEQGFDNKLKSITHENVSITIDTDYLALNN